LKKRKLPMPRSEVRGQSCLCFVFCWRCLSSY
jgi:hypothetical protein